MRRLLAASFLAGCWLLHAPCVRAEFNLQFSIVNSSVPFTTQEIDILNAALVKVEAMWERAITGYQPGISIPSVTINVRGSSSGLASASFFGTTTQGGFTLATSGNININVNEIENFAAWPGVTTGPCLIPGNGLNFIDELLAHETGHVLGVGTLWATNNLLGGASQYLGQHGLAAYQQEFEPGALFVPVEDAGSEGTQGSHWDQRMRSSSQEGDPNAPWCLDPRVGVVDHEGRDRGLELMTGAIDPDHLEPFLSLLTVESMRDLGYTVTRFEDFDGNGLIDIVDRDILLGNLGASGLGIDSVSKGDANRDRVVNFDDLRLWQEAAGVPEPGTVVLAAAALLIAVAARRRS